jgi:HEAT repeat protein
VHDQREKDMNKKTNRSLAAKLLGVTAMFLLLVSSLHALQESDVYLELLSFEHGKSREAFWKVENQIRQAGPQAKLEIHSRLLKALDDPRATPDARQAICRVLTMIGSCESVPVLKPLLLDEQLSDAARTALEGLPCPEVDSIFRETVAVTGGRVRLGLIASLAERRDREAVNLLNRLLKESEPATALAVIAALGRIGGQQAAGVLKSAASNPSLEAASHNAYLSCAASLLAEGRNDDARRIYQDLLNEKGAVGAAALTGLVRVEKEGALDHVLAGLHSPHPQVRQAAASLLGEVPGSVVVRKTLNLLPGLPPEDQVAVIAALGVRRAVEALPLLHELWRSEHEAVRVAAGQALGTLGDRTSVEPLIRSVKASGAIGSTAQESLRVLFSDGVDEAIAGYAEDSDPAMRVVALRTLTARRYSGTPSIAFAGLRDPDANARIESWRSLAVFGKPEDLPRLIELMVKLEESREQQAAEQAIQVVADPMPKDQAAQLLIDVMPGATSAQRCSLYRTLGRIGGERSFVALRRAIDDPDGEVQDTAIRALSEWGDYSVSEDLLHLARQGKKESHRILGLRGYVRLAGLNRHDNEDRVKMYKTALSVARRADEKKLVLGAAGGVPSAAALKLVEPYLTSNTLKSEAQAAYLKIAAAVAPQDPVRATAALRKLIRVGADPELKARAEEALQRLVSR